MDVHTEPRGESYDVVVVGAGLAGVSAGAFLSKAGRKVLVVERLDGPGGYAHVFRRGSHVFDPAIHAIGRGKGGAMSVEDVLELLGVADRVTFLPFHDPFYTAILDGFRFDVPFGLEEYIETHVQLFPREADRFREFIALCERVVRELEQARQIVSLSQMDATTDSFANLLRYRSATAGDVINEYLTDPQLIGASTAAWPNLGLPPSRAAFSAYAAMLIPLLQWGQSYCQGSFQSLVNAFVAAIEENGGELVLKQQVSRIVLQDGKAAGVTLEDGRDIRASTVISNADLMHTLEKLVGFEHVPDAYIRRLTRLKPALSAYQVYAASALDLSQSRPSHETFWYRSWDHDENYQRNLAGQAYQVAVSMPSLVDPSLAPPGQHVATIVAFMPYDIGMPWSEARPRLKEELLDVAEASFPGFRDHLTYAEDATPLSMERYTLNYRGAAYGWENSPTNIGSKRPANQTPIEGLLLTGHWTQPGFGSLGAIYSGMGVSQTVLGCADAEEFLRMLNPQAA